MMDWTETENQIYLKHSVPILTVVNTHIYMKWPMIGTINLKYYILFYSIYEGHLGSS